MLDLKNAEVSTLIDYDQIYRATTYFLKLKFKIPGGFAIYDIPTTKEINTSLEAVNKLK